VNFKKILATLGVVALLLAVGTAAYAAGGTSQGWGKGKQVASGERCGAGIGLGRINGGMSSSVADFLGLSQSDLVAARQSGKSLVQIASEQGKTEQQLVDFIVENRTAQLDQLVADGIITQAQADQHITYMADQVKAQVNRTTTGKAGRSSFGPGGGRGMGMGMGNGTGICPYGQSASK
jgi:hypothetical protein